jgi:DNA-binding transcriptional LysR family regulator
MRMNLAGTVRQFRHFIALADTGSFTRAAAQCHLSQPAFSRSISVLEQGLGVALIDRIGKRCELTAVGQSVLEHARHVVFDTEELARCVATHAQGATGHFRLGIGSTPGALLGGPLLAEVANNFPSLRIDIKRAPLKEQVGALRDRKLDALLVDLRSVLATPDLHIEPIAALQGGAMCRAGHPLARRGESLRFVDLLEYPIASTVMSDELARLLVSAYGPAAHPGEMIRLLCEDVTSLLEATLQSDAVFLGVLQTARRLLATGELVQLTMSDPMFDAPYALVRLVGRSVPPFYAHLRAFIQQRLADANAAAQPAADPAVAVRRVPRTPIGAVSGGPAAPAPGHAQSTRRRGLPQRRR